MVRLAYVGISDLLLNVDRDMESNLSREEPHIFHSDAVLRYAPGCIWVCAF